MKHTKWERVFNMEFVTLSNGVKMPILGYGVYQVTKEECERCVLDALKAGYRSIDTAQSYFNEEKVGSAITKSGVPREEIFFTTKVWIEHYGYEECKASVLESMRKLQTDYIDLMLLHQPFGDYYGAWRALEDLYNCKPPKRSHPKSSHNSKKQDCRLLPQATVLYYLHTIHRI